jgi:hypothetical protein
MSKTFTNFVHALVAVLAGNAAYFLLVKYLPERARHTAFHIDLGMVVDFWLCLVVLGLIKTIARRRQDAKPPKAQGLVIGCLDFGQRCLTLSSTAGYFRNLGSSPIEKIESGQPNAEDFHAVRRESGGPLHVRSG